MQGIAQVLGCTPQKVQTTGGEDNAASPSREKVRVGKKVETEKELPKTPAVSPKEVQSVGSEENVHHPSQGKIQAGENVEHEAEQETALPNASDEVRALEKERNKARLAFRKAEKEVASAQRAYKSAEEKYRRSNSDSDYQEWCEKERVLREAKGVESDARNVLSAVEWKLAKQLEDEKRKEEKRNKDNRMMSFVQQGLSVNKSRTHKKFVEHEFDFKSYYQWADHNTTSVQRDRIFERRLLLNSYRSCLYKEFVRCGIALVPDGLSFAVQDVQEVNHYYRVSLELLTYGCTITGKGKWQGNPVQDDDLRDYLRKKFLFPSSIYLGIPAAAGILAADGGVENWRKGTILVSNGWVYDVEIIDAIKTFKDGTKRPFKDVCRAEFAFRSMGEWLHFESRVSFFE